MWLGFIRSRIWTVVGLLRRRWWTSGFNKSRRVSWPDERVLTSQETLLHGMRQCVPDCLTFALLDLLSSPPATTYDPKVCEMARYSATLRNYVPLSLFIANWRAECRCNRTLRFVQLTFVCLFVCLFVFSGLCDSCTLVKWQILRNTISIKFCFNRERPTSDTFEILKKSLVMMP